MSIKLPILAYHRVHRNHDITHPHDGGRVNVSEFIRQMDYLRERSFQTVTHRQIAAWLLEGVELPKRPVAIDFDDNRLNVLENAFPIMAERGLLATVFVITDLADGKGVFGPNDYPAMRWEHLRRLYQAGWCIAPHTRRHLWLAGPQRAPKDDTEVWEELIESKRRVEQQLDINCPYFAYPNGSWNPNVETMVKQVFQTARLWQSCSDGSWPLTTVDTNPHRLMGINISEQMDFETFCQIIDGSV